MGDSWVGGDIGGLHTMATTYKNAKDKLDGVVKVLSKAVDKLADDASWKGEAAKTFRGVWSEDEFTAGAFAELVSEVGGILATSPTRCRPARRRCRTRSTSPPARACRRTPRARRCRS